MANHLVSFLAFVASVLVAIKIVPGIRARSIGAGVVFAIVFGVLDKLLFGVLALVSLPFVILTLGLFLLVIHAFVFWLTDKIVSSVEADGFGSAFLGALVTTLCNLGFHMLLR